MSRFEVDCSEMKSFISDLQKIGGNNVKRELNLFVDGIGTEFLEIVCEEIINRKVVDTRGLLNSFQRGDSDNIWTWSDNNLALEVGSSLEYAAPVNDGHWTCKTGEKGRFVPGRWEGERFIYDPDADTGMYLKQQWISGRPYFDSAWKIMDKMFPDLFESKIDDIFARFFE